MEKHQALSQIADYSALSLLHQRVSAVECGDWFDYCFVEAIGDLSQGRYGNIDLRHQENPRYILDYFADHPRRVLNLSSWRKDHVVENGRSAMF